MYQEAINTLVGLMGRFPQTFKLEVIDENNVILHYDLGEESKEESFDSAQQMIEWMEENLAQK